MVQVALSSLRPREKGRVVSIAGGLGVARRLMEIGVLPGEVVEVLSNSFGPVVIRTRGVTFALGRGLASKVLVEVVS
ncbi:MAG: ferrous iron transport protein A [Candidatus Korarchaeum sp.]|nr:ferrous iron transport protein A [Candidatus Korarchaeum sp.]MDW8036067.1 FeoA family protein [Candidatus Korarchaeum sp.]